MNKTTPSNETASAKNNPLRPTRNNPLRPTTTDTTDTDSPSGAHEHQRSETHTQEVPWEAQVKAYYQTHFERHRAPSVDALLARSTDTNSSPNRVSIHPLFLRLGLLGALVVICGLSAMALQQKSPPKTSQQITQTSSSQLAHTAPSRSSDLETLSINSSDMNFLSFGQHTLPSDGWFIDDDSDRLGDELPENVTVDTESKDTAYFAVDTDIFLLL